MMGHFYTTVLVLVLLSISACQTAIEKTVSIEEAKQITAKFGQQSFVAPPRTIQDIVEILDQQKLADPDAAREIRLRIAQEPDPGIAGLELARFYHRRGLAAEDIGATRQQVADLKQAERLSEGDSGDLRAKILWDLGVAEYLAGKSADGLQYRQQAMDLLRSKGSRMVKGALLGASYANAGDLKTADRFFQEAATTYEKAKTWSGWSRYGDSWTRNVLSSEGRILYAKGRYQEAEEKFREALDAAESIINNSSSAGNDHIAEMQLRYTAIHVSNLRADIAMSLVKQSRLVEAEVMARTGLTGTLQKFGRYSSNTALMVRKLASVITAQGRFAEAERLARAAIDIYAKIGVPEDASVLAAARRKLAGILVRRGRWQAALTEYNAIEAALATDPGLFKRVYAVNLDWAIALSLSDQNDKARRTAELGLQRALSAVGAKHYDTAEARGVLAMTLGHEGEGAAALRIYREALPILLSHSRQSDSAEAGGRARDFRLRLILESYIGLLSEIRGGELEQELKLDAADEAFRIADVARSRSVQAALAASGARSTAGDPELANLIRREQDARKQIAALFGLLANVMALPSNQRDEKAIPELRTRIDSLRIARASIAEEIERRFPNYAELINPKPATIPKLQASLRPDEAMISTYVARKETYVWAFGKTGKPAFAVVDLTREDVSDLVDNLRLALNPEISTLGDIPRFDLLASHELFRNLLAPVAAGWKPAKSLVVVAQGALAQLPFSVLVTKNVSLPPEKGALFANYKAVPWLVRDYAVTVLPSVTALASLRAVPPASGKRRAFVGFGDPYFSVAQAAKAEREEKTQVAAITSRGGFASRGLPVRLRSVPKTRGIDSADLGKLPRLPDTKAEIESIAAALKADPSRDVFLGLRASEAAVKTLDLSGYKVLAFATHGLVPGDLDGLLQPALALSAPEGAGAAADGLLSMDEILGLRLNADWVVLSACNTAAGGEAGAEAYSGLGQAFFYAGTRAMLLSNWPVETTSARALTTDIFRRHAADPALPRAQALRQAMLGLIDGPGLADPKSGKVLFSYAHPIFWGPFSLVGDGGGPENQQQ